MDRRNFIKLGALGAAGALLLNPILNSCSGTSLSLKEIIGQKQDILKDYPKEGNNDFGYYLLTNFKDGSISGEQVLVFYENGIITGYTIKANGTSKAEKVIKDLEESYGNKNKSFANDYGQEYYWNSGKRKITLCYSSGYKNMPEYTFYSESLTDKPLAII